MYDAESFTPVFTTLCHTHYSLHSLFPPFPLCASRIKRIYQTGLVEKLLSGTLNRLPWKSAGASVYYNPTSGIISGGRSAVAVLAPADLRSVYILWSFGVATALGCFLYEALLHLLFTRTHIKSTNSSSGGGGSCAWHHF